MSAEGVQDLEMPEKFKIMRAVRDGLNSIRVDKSVESDAWWTKTVKTELCKIGRKFGCKVGAKADEVDEADRDYGEWLYDVTWLEYERERDGLKWPATALIKVPLVAECEWGVDENLEYIIEDFEKLLLARADVRLMIFDGNQEPGSKEIADMLARKIRLFDSTEEGDAWLLAAWEGSNQDWSFRYFTIKANQAVPFPPPN